MKILLAEDDFMLADFLAEILVDDGHVVCGVAATVAEAVALARKHHPDIAILDMQLRAGQRGSDIVDRLAESNDLGGTGILYVTGQSARVHKEARFGHACLDKPYDIASLYAAIEIVYEVAHLGDTSRPLPRGMALLQNRAIGTDAHQSGAAPTAMPRVPQTHSLALLRPQHLNP